MKKRRKLSASVISTKLFPTRRWYRSRDKLWYYHGPRKHVEIPEAVDFGESVDSDLEPLVRFLHLRRIPTTPSCQGHFDDRDHFEKVWRRLQEDSERIRGQGLRLEDVETGEQVLFQRSDYELPWGSLDAFYEDAGSNQQKGYIGFYVRDPEIKTHLRHILTGPSEFNFFREAGDVGSRTLFALGVRKKDEEEQKKEWSRWTRKIRDAFLGLY